MEKFERIRGGYFDVTSEDATDVVMADSKKTFVDQEEDAKFIQRLRNNQKVAFEKSASGNSRGVLTGP